MGNSCTFLSLEKKSFFFPLFSCVLLSCPVFWSHHPPLTKVSLISEFCVVEPRVWHALSLHTFTDICRFTFALTCLFIL